MDLDSIDLMSKRRGYSDSPPPRKNGEASKLEKTEYGAPFFAAPQVEAPSEEELDVTRLSASSLPYDPTALEGVPAVTDEQVAEAARITPDQKSELEAAMNGAKVDGVCVSVSDLVAVLYGNSDSFEDAVRNARIRAAKPVAEESEASNVQRQLAQKVGLMKSWITQYGASYNPIQAAQRGLSEPELPYADFSAMVSDYDLKTMKELGMARFLLANDRRAIGAPHAKLVTSNWNSMWASIENGDLCFSVGTEAILSPEKKQELLRRRLAHCESGKSTLIPFALEELRHLPDASVNSLADAVVIPSLIASQSAKEIVTKDGQSMTAHIDGSTIFFSLNSK